MRSVAIDPNILRFSLEIATTSATSRLRSRFDTFLRRMKTMPRGDKSAYTDKQQRQAEHIEEGYEHRGVSEHEAERRAWATVNKETGGGKKSGGGRGKAENHAPSRKGGKLGGAAAASRPAAVRSAAAKKAAATRKRKASHG
jgi:plasmid stabilization system protein ParE